MILKTKRNRFEEGLYSWEYVDKIDEMTVDGGSKGELEKKLYFRRGEQWTEEIVNNESYLLSDTGKTIERLN